MVPHVYACFLDSFCVSRFLSVAYDFSFRPIIYGTHDLLEGRVSQSRLILALSSMPSGAAPHVDLARYLLRPTAIYFRRIPDRRFHVILFLFPSFAWLFIEAAHLSVHDGPLFCGVFRTSCPASKESTNMRSFRNVPVGGYWSFLSI